MSKCGLETLTDSERQRQSDQTHGQSESEGNQMYYGYIGATHGVTVCTSAFLACYQCYCAGSSLALGLNFRALVKVALSEAHRQWFSPGTPVSSPPSLVNSSANKKKLTYMRFKLCQT